jgi:hypothetical protein
LVHLSGQAVCFAAQLLVTALKTKAASDGGSRFLCCGARLGRGSRWRAPDNVETQRPFQLQSLFLFARSPSFPEPAHRRCCFLVMSQPAQTGGCACGAIRYRINAALTDCGYCHCRMCQRASGAPVLVFASAPVDALDITSGRPCKRRSSPFAERWHCTHCGTQLAMRTDYDPGAIDIAVVTLDDPTLAAPQFHIWRESALPWFETADELKRYRRARPGHEPPR